MKRRFQLMAGLMLIGMLLTETGVAWAKEPAEVRGLRGQVAAIEGTTLLVTTISREECRAITDGDTRFYVPGVPGPTIEDIDVGDYVGVRGERTEAGDLLARAVLVVPAERAHCRNIARGEVLAVEDLTLVVQTRLGEKWVITDEATHFRIPSAEQPTIEDISVGDPALAVGRCDEDGNLRARVVAVVSGRQLRRHTLRGIITSIEDDTFGLATPGRLVRVVTTQRSVFRIPGVEDPGADDLRFGDLIGVFGTWDAEEEVFVARVVRLMPRWPSHVRFIRGEVTGIEGRTIVLDAWQPEVAVLTDGDRTFRIPGVEDPGLDDLQVGDWVGALVARSEEAKPAAKVVVVRRGRSALSSEILGPIEASTAMLRALPWQDVEQ